MGDTSDSFGSLTELVKNEGQYRYDCLLLAYDPEDGFFLAAVDNHDLHRTIPPIKMQNVHKDLKKAIETALKIEQPQTTSELLGKMEELILDDTRWTDILLAYRPDHEGYCAHLVERGQTHFHPVKDLELKTKRSNLLEAIAAAVKFDKSPRRPVCWH